MNIPKATISPYPDNVRVNTARQVFCDGKYLGYVDKVSNWGTDFLARPALGRNKFFGTQTEAVRHILSSREEITQEDWDANPGPMPPHME